MRSPFLLLLAVPLLAGCPGPQAKPCEGVACGPQGQCAVDGNNRPVCSCSAGFVAEGLTCVVEKSKNPCDPNPCTLSGRTVCAVANGAARCDCDPGRHEQAGACVIADPCQPNPCTAPNQGVCTAKGGAALCSCNAGYAPEGAGCSAQPVYDCNARHSGGPTDDVLEPDECPNLARDIDTGGSVETGHTLSPAGDADWVRISGEAGRIYELKASADPSLKLYADAYRADGVTSVGFDHRVQNEVLFRFRADATEPHFARIRGARSNDTGSYSLSVTDKGADDYADVPAGALEVTIGATLEGEIQFGRDADVFKLKMEGTHAYELTGAWPQGPTLVLELLAEDGTALQKDQGPSPKLLFRAPVAGTYYLRATSAMEALGKFTVNLKDSGADDHGDVPADATALKPAPDVKMGNFERLGDVDAFSFSATPDHIYSFTCNPMPTTGACNVVLTDAVGAVLASDTNGYSALVNYKATKAQTLFLKATSTSLTAYTYKLEDLGTDDHGDTAAAATPLTAGPIANGNLEVLNDLDFFSFSAAAGRLYRFTCSPSSSLQYCAVRLLTANGVTLVSSSSTGIVSYESPTAQTLYVEVKAYYTTNLGTYTYRLEDLGTDDHGDTYAAATSVVLGAPPATGNIETAADVDVFSFTATAGRIYRFNCVASSTLNSCSLRLLNAQGSLLLSATATLTYEATLSGAFYVEVRGYSTSYTGTYTYQVQDLGADDFGDAPGTATAVTVGAAAATGNIETAGDVDVFSFSATAGRIYRVNCVPSSALYQCPTRILNAAGTQLATGTNTAAFRPPAAATYYAEVKGYSSSYVGSYTYQVEDLGPEDHGDTPATATALTPNAPLANGQLLPTEDLDVFSFSATAGRIYRFTCTPSSQLVYCTVRFLNASGTTLVTGSTAATWVANATGTTYVEVKPTYSGYMGAYTYLLEDLGADDHGNDLANATAISPGAATSAAVQFSGDADFFSFNATANRIYRFTCTASTSLYSCPVRLYNAAGTLIATSSGTGTSTASAKLTAAGKIFAEVRGYSTSYTGAYTYQLQDIGLDDHGDTPAAATAITAGSPAATGNIEVTSDVDYLSFNAVSGRIYRFTCTASTALVYCAVRVVNAAGTALASQTSAAATLVFEAASSGPLYVEIISYASSYTGAYTYALEDLGLDDHGDTPTAATAITAGAPTSGKLETAADEDWFSLTLNAGSYQVLGSMNLGLTVFTSNGVTTVASSNGTTALSFTAAAAGTYYVRVKPYTFSPTNNAYTVTVQ